MTIQSVSKCKQKLNGKQPCKLLWLSSFLEYTPVQHVKLNHRISEQVTFCSDNKHFFPTLAEGPLVSSSLVVFLFSSSLEKLARGIHFWKKNREDLSKIIAFLWGN